MNCGRKIGPFDCCSVVQGDCLELMKQLPDGAVDAVITDPPYFTNECRGGKPERGSFRHKWTGLLKESDPSQGILQSVTWGDFEADLYRICQDGSNCYICTNDKNIATTINCAVSAGWKLHNILVWIKDNGTPNRWYMKNGEFVVYLFKPPSTPIPRLNSMTCNFYPMVRDKVHPTQKPIEWLGLMAANCGQLILDPFCGSGSTLVAATRINKHYLGFESSPEYCALARKRLAETEAIPMWAREETHDETPSMFS